MSGEAFRRVVILSGPSCVGKSPLDKALGRFYPELRGTLRKLVLYNSRAPRPGEVDGVDYHFRMRSQVEALRAEDRYAVLDVRGDLQALDVEELHAMLQDSNAFFEGNPYCGPSTPNAPALGRHRSAQCVPFPPLASRGHLLEGAGAQCFTLRSRHRPHAAQTAATHAPPKT